MNLGDPLRPTRAPAARVSMEAWGAVPGGDVAHLYTLRNAHGMRVTISDLGATLVSWHAPDRAGRIADILLGHDTPAEYAASHAYFGSTVGRWANRIAQARFTLDGIAYALDRNDGDNLLHGGATGLHRLLWQAEELDGTLLLSCESPEGDAGFPGAVAIRLCYRLDDDGALTLSYEATSDAPTPINLTNHAYFNLSGDTPADAPDIRGHMVSIDADAFFAVDPATIPMARVEVAGSAFDFRTSAPVGTRLDWPHAQLARTGGFDHCYLVGRAGSAGGLSMRPVATVYDPGSGRELTVSTDTQGLQFYTGNHLDGVVGRGARSYRSHAGLCLEAGAYPNQINMADAESVVLRPGACYRQTTQYRIGVR